MIRFKQQSIKHVSPLSFIPLTEICFCIKSRNTHQARFLLLSIIITFVTILIRPCHNLPEERDKLISPFRYH